MGLFSEGRENLSGNRYDFLKGKGSAIVILESAVVSTSQKKKVPQTILNFKAIAIEPDSSTSVNKGSAFRYCKADDQYGSGQGTLLSAVSGFGGVRIDTLEHTLEDLEIGEKYNLAKPKDKAIAEVDADEAFDAMLAEMTSGEGEAWKGRVAQVTWSLNTKGTFTNVRFDPLPPGTVEDGVFTTDGIAFMKKLEWEVSEAATPAGE